LNDARFDRIVRDLASGISRRAIIRTAAAFAGMAGLKASSALASANGNAQCAAFCRSVFPPGAERGQCVEEAARGTGACAPACAGSDACISLYGGCGGSGLCFCATTVESVGLCLDVDLVACGTGCHTSAECGDGAVCVQTDCCSKKTAPSVCVPLSAKCRGLPGTIDTGGVRVRWP
jgi:hypothetical protein